MELYSSAKVALATALAAAADPEMAHLLLDNGFLMVCSARYFSVGSGRQLSC